MDKKLYINPPLVNRVYDWKNGPQPKTRAALDKFFNSPAIRKVKQQICEMGRRIYNKGYTDGNGGNISVRVGEDLVLCTPTLCCKGFMEEKDICLVDMRTPTPTARCCCSRMRMAARSISSRRSSSRISSRSARRWVSRSIRSRGFTTPVSSTDIRCRGESELVPGAL